MSKRPDFPMIKSIAEDANDYELAKVIGWNEAVQQAFAWATWKEHIESEEDE